MLGDEEINYIDIFDPDGNTLYETQDGVTETIPGVHTFTTKKGAEQTMDFRLNNLWDLMFHGSIENATKNEVQEVTKERRKNEKTCNKEGRTSCQESRAQQAQVHNL